MKGVISIGSHYGEEYEGWLSEGATKFIFFEPVFKNYCKLRKVVPDVFDISIYNLAIGNMTGEVEMFIEDEHQGKSCSILEPFLHLKQYPDIEFVRKETVKIDKLDNVAYNRSLYDHLHIDTQGYEMEVLKGAEKSLNQIETINIEVYREELYKGCAMYEDIFDYLTLKGFHQTEVYWRGNTWGDAKFRRVHNLDYNLPYESTSTR